MSILRARVIDERFTPQVAWHFYLLAYVELDVRLAVSNMWDVSTQTLLETVAVDELATSNSRLLPMQSLRWRNPRLARLWMGTQCERSYGAPYTDAYGATYTDAYALL